jgi:hypothetical protein
VKTWTSIWMATLAAGVVMQIACTSPRGRRDTSSTPAADQRPAPRLDHIAPPRDSIGAAPKFFEWTPVDGADRYALGILNDIDVIVWRRDDIRTTSIDWPPALELEFGTYMWSVTALRGDIPLAESGRSAFVISR